MPWRDGCSRRDGRFEETVASRRDGCLWREVAPGETVAFEETVALGETVASREAIASGERSPPESQGDCPDRYALIIDDDRMHIGRTAMRMNQMGIPSYYARDPDEGILFALQEPGRIRALLVSSETDPRDVERVAQQVATQSQGIDLRSWWSARSSTRL